MINTSEIRANTARLLRERDIPLHPHLPLLDVKAFRSPEDICKKIVTLYSLAGLANGAEGDLLKEWLIEDGFWKFLTESEKKNFEVDDLNTSLINELSWKQESLYTLSWCGKFVDSLFWPTSECDLSNIFHLIPPEKSFSDFSNSFEMRKESELVENLDIYYCLHTSLVHPEIWADQESKNQLKIEVVLERRQALEWVCNSSTSWQDINLDT